MDLPSSSPANTALDRLADHCITARTMIDEAGTPVMRRLIDILLFEIGLALADPLTKRDVALDTVE